MKETLKSIFYIARRFRLATTFNLIGLVVAYAAFYLLMTQIWNQYSYNHGIDDYQRLYRLESDFTYEKYSDLVSRPFAEALKLVPEVESYSLYANIKNGNESYYDFPCYKGDSIVNYKITMCNNTGVSTLTSKVLDGRIEWTDADSTNRGLIVIPASIALNQFGTVHAADSVMGGQYQVMGVYEDFPEDSELSNCIFFNMGDMDLTGTSFIFKCIIKFKSRPEDDGVMADRIMKAILQEYDQTGWENYFTADYMTATEKIEAIANAKSNYGHTKIRITPLSNSFFESTSFSPGDRGHKPLLIILLLSCVLIIIVACINFLNFTLAESPMRVRGLNTRLVLGARRASLRRGLVLEGVVTSVFACLLALVLCSVIAVIGTGGLTEGSLSLSSHKMLAAALVVISIIVGFVSGLYPAFLVTSFQPAMALKGYYSLSPQGKKLRTVLVFLQLLFSMVMLIYIGILLLQSRFIHDREGCGYDNEQILSTYLPYDEENRTRNRNLYNDLIQMPEVEGISFTNAVLGSIDSHSTERGTIGDYPIKYSLMEADTAFMQTMGIKVIEGRDFLPTDSMAVIVNKGAVEHNPWLRLGMKVSISSSQENLNDSAAIIGVCDDIRFGTTRIDNHQPFFIIFDLNSPLDCVNIRIAPDCNRDTVRRQIMGSLNKYFGSRPVTLDDNNSMISKAYKSEFRSFRQMNFLTVISLLITLVGVFCLTIFETEYRRKEIGLRKVAGATTGKIVWVFCRRYGTLLLISFAIAAPIAYFGGNKTLSYFAEHVTFSTYWWLFPTGLLAVGAITLGTVAFQSWRAAHENPVNSIRNE